MAASDDGRTMRARVFPFAAVLVVAASCGASHRPANDRAIAIYSAAIRVVLTGSGPQTSTTGPHGPVFVLAADKRSPLSLEVQAGVVDALHTLATIRFVDDRSEAIDETDPLAPVHDHGVLLTLGKIPRGRNNVTIQVQRYEQAGVTATEQIRLRRTGSSWAP
jgi:hypothetical protein